MLGSQALRKPRTDWAVATAANNGKGLHLGAGKDQEARDAAFRSAAKGGGQNPDKAIDKRVPLSSSSVPRQSTDTQACNRATQRILYAHDCVKEAEERYDELFAQV